MAIARQQLSGGGLPVEEIRTHFPALERRYNRLPVAYSDAPDARAARRGEADSIFTVLMGDVVEPRWLINRGGGMTRAVRTTDTFKNSQK